MNVLYTIGYGNNTPDTFMRRLLAAGIRRVYDIRRAGTSAWNYWYRPGVAMAGLLSKDGIEYVPRHEYGSSGDLEGYEHWLTAADTYDMVRDFAAEIKRLAVPVCLLCAEKCPVASSGDVLCHRVLLADMLADVGNLRVEHL